MKKVLAVILAVALVFSMSITAFATTKSDVKEKIDKSANYLVSTYKEKGFGANDSKILLSILKAGQKADEFKSDYVKSVVETLKGEKKVDLGNLSLYIEVLNYYGVDLENVEGINLKEEFKNSTYDNVNPYLFYNVIEAAKVLGLEDFAKDTADYFVKKYYKMGVGADYWNYVPSTDDMGIFFITIKDYKDDYKEIVEDAIKIVEKSRFANGYGYGEGSENADSTAMALASYVVYGDEEKAEEIYNILINNFFIAENGAFSYMVKDGNANPMATYDALIGMEIYCSALAQKEQSENNEEQTTVPQTQDNEENNNESTTSTTQKTEEVKENESETSPNTGKNTLALATSLMGLGLVSVLALKKKNK